MKLACDGCGAKYSIPDERVVGKTFKVRCKKCSFVIVVRNADVPAASGEWFVVSDGTQLGPFDRAELLRRGFAGDALVWREGMEDWAALDDIAELRSTSTPTSSELFSTAKPADEPMTEEAQPKLRGERNETSVLFTLGNLAKLAATTPPAKASAAPTTSPAPGGEGSGLIDIRALATTMMPAAQAKPASSTGSLDDIPTFGPVGFADPIVLVPQARSTNRNKLMLVLVGMLALLLVVSAVLVVILVRDEPRAKAVIETPTPTPVVETPPPPQVAVAPAPPVVEPPPAQTEKREPKEQRVANVQVKKEPVKKEPVKKEPVKKEPVKKEPVKKEPVKEACDEITCAANGYAGACCDPFRPKSDRKSPSADLPDNLDRNAIAAGLGTIKAQTCGNRSSAKGDVRVSIKVSPDGSVANVTIKESPDAALGACVVDKAKQGSFAKSVRGSTFAYVWRF